MTRVWEAVVPDPSSGPGNHLTLSNGDPSGNPDPPPARVKGRQTGPIVVEFAGTPRAGKTSAMHALAERLTRCGHNVHLVEELAQLSPVPSSEHPRFNLWTATTTTSMMIQAVYLDADIVLVDRGLFDSLCWLEWYRRSKWLSGQDSDAIEQFLCVTPLTLLTDVVLVMTVDPIVALEREEGTWPPGTVKSAGTIMNMHTLHALNSSITATVSRHRDKFVLRQFDTTTARTAQTVDKIAAAIREVVHIPT